MIDVEAIAMEALRKSGTTGGAAAYAAVAKASVAAGMREAAEIARTFGHSPPNPNGRRELLAREIESDAAKYEKETP